MHTDFAAGGEASTKETLLVEKVVWKGEPCFVFKCEAVTAE